MTLTVTTFTNGQWKQNCYTVGNAMGEMLVIDPGGAQADIEEAAENGGEQPLAIINTHAHYDHIGAVAGLMKRYSIPFYLHKDDLSLMQRANLYRFIFDSENKITIPDRVEDLGALHPKTRFGDFEVTVLPTPGHTQGSVCLLIANLLFSGDTLLPNGPGRTDLPGGDKNQLKSSVASLFDLPRGTLVYPGHGRHFDLHERFPDGVSAPEGE